MAVAVGPAGAGRELAEALKELACLHGIADLFAASGTSPARALARACPMVRAAFQYPSRVAARIVFRGRTVQTRAWREEGPRLAAALRPNGRAAGSIAVCWTGDPPWGTKRPFLPSERRLLASMARFTEGLIARGEAENALRAAQARLLAQQRRLERKNAALVEMVALAAASRREVRGELAAELAEAILPSLAMLRDPGLPRERLLRLVALVERAVRDVGAGFTRRIASAHATLSPRESEVADLIAAGSSSKDVARILHLSPATVERHRHNVRRKLGLVGGEANLTSWLRSAR